MIDSERQEEFNKKCTDIFNWLIHALDDFTAEHIGEAGLDVNWNEERKLLKEAEFRRQELIKEYSIEKHY